MKTEWNWISILSKVYVFGWDLSWGGKECRKVC